MLRVVKKHPLAIRWFHWLNFPILALMIWSGTLILWANDVYATQLYQIGYRMTHGGTESETPPVWLKVPNQIVLAPVFRVVYAGDPVPEEPRTELALGSRLGEGMAWHFALAWLFTLNGLAYVVFLAASGQWRHLLPRKESFREAIKVAVKDLAFWRRIEAAPEGLKYNDAQRIAYSAVVVLGALMLITGLAIYKPAQVAWLAVPFGGYQGARLVHFVVTCLFIAFFFVHVSQVVRAGWNNFRAMLTGWEVVGLVAVPPEAISPAHSFLVADPLPQPLVPREEEDSEPRRAGDGRAGDGNEEKEEDTA